MIAFTIGCGVGILIGFVMFAFLSANREESLVRELVAALKKSPHDFECHISEGHHSARCQHVRALIAKAEGRAQ